MVGLGGRIYTFFRWKGKVSSKVLQDGRLEDDEVILEGLRARR